MNTQINCIIIDDEPLAINVIKSHLKHFKDIIIKNTFTNPAEALQCIHTGNIDVVFLDINMPHINGLDFIKNLKNKPQIVITTAYREYAIDSFEIGVLDYLVKPISFKRFMKTIDRVTNEFLNQKSNDKDYTFIKVNKKLIKIYFKDILYIESLRDYVKLVTKNDDFLLLSSMNAILEQFPDNFIRVHRSFSINQSHIISLDGNLIELPNRKIPIGRNYINQVKKAILD